MLNENLRIEHEQSNEDSNQVKERKLSSSENLSAKKKKAKNDSNLSSGSNSSQRVLRSRHWKQMY